MCSLDHSISSHDKRFYLGQSFHNKTTIVRQISLTQLEKSLMKRKSCYGPPLVTRHPWPGLAGGAPIHHQRPGPGKMLVQPDSMAESRWLLYGNFGFNIQFRSRVSESEKCVITSIRSAEPSCGFLQVQSFCIGSGCNCTDHLRLLPSIAKCKM